MTGPEVDDPRRVLKRWGLYAKKSWGQNFLCDPRVHAAIAQAAAATAEDWIVEIGAGLGTLTARLLERAGRVLAVERDRDMTAVLRGELGGRERLEIVEQNALELDYPGLATMRSAISFCSMTTARATCRRASSRRNKSGEAIW